MSYDWHFIQLKKNSESLFTGQIENHQLLQTGEFYLAIKSQMAEAKLVETFPCIVKIASHNLIDRVVQSSLPGLVISSIKPPFYIPNHPYFHYFMLDTTGAYWENIKASPTVAIYVPDEISVVELKMYASFGSTPYVFNSCYEAIESYLNIFVDKEFRWSCVRLDEQQLYPWNDPIHQGKTRLKIKVEKNSSGIEKYYPTMKESTEMGSAVLITEVDQLVRNNQLYTEFYLMIEWEERIMSLFPADLTIGAWQKPITFEIPLRWFESMKICLYPMTAKKL